MRKIEGIRRQRWHLSLEVPALLVLTVLPFIRGSSAAQPSCPPFEGYDTVAGQDAGLGDLVRVNGNASVAGAACEVVPTCVGFNSRGWLKANLTNWKNDSTICTYVRQGPAACPSFPGYVTRPGEDADGNDIWRPANWDPYTAYTVCDSNPWCRGFNNKGYIKHTLANWKADPVLCTYVRDDVWWQWWYEAGAAGQQIGTAANANLTSCLTIDPNNNGYGVMRACHNFKDRWGTYGQYLRFIRVIYPVTYSYYMYSLSYRLFRILVDAPITQGSYYFSGGCLTRGSTGDRVRVTSCEFVESPDAPPQEWFFTPVTISGISGFRIGDHPLIQSVNDRETRSATCLQMGSGVSKDMLFLQQCADDVRQLFAITSYG